MVWSWTAEGSALTSPSQKDLTPQLLVSTWVVPHTAEVVQVVLAAIHVTTTADMIGDTTEAGTIAMTIGITTDHTEGDLLHRTTEVRTGPGPDPGLTLHAATEHLHPRQTSSSPRSTERIMFDWYMILILLWNLRDHQNL